MKLYAPDKSVLMEVTAIREHPDGLVIEGKIMGAMPMKAILRADEMRGAFRLLRWSTMRRVLAMLIRGRKTP